MGEFEVPESALYGASTARAVENFPISDLKFSRTFIRSLAEIKKACALVNQKNKLLEKIPSQKFGLPEDVAAAAVFLASDEASYINGATIHLNGGLAMI